MYDPVLKSRRFGNSEKQVEELSLNVIENKSILDFDYIAEQENCMTTMV